VPGAIYSLGTHFEATALKGSLMALQGPPASKGLRWGWSWQLWKDPDSLFL